MGKECMMWENMIISLGFPLRSSFLPGSPALLQGTGDGVREEQTTTRGDEGWGWMEKSGYKETRGYDSW